MADTGAGRVLSPSEVLERIPQQHPFRFVDEILEIDEAHVVSAVRFREDADFYRGHFPGNPITPGVILIEAMAQAGVVAHGLWLVAKELGPEALEKLLTIFTDAQVDFSGMVRPGERVITHAEKQFFRRRLLRSKVEMRREDGQVVCSGVLSGMGVLR